MQNIDIFYQALDDLIREYHDNPFNFLYEFDLQAYLFSVLYQKYKEEQPIKMKGGYWPESQYGGQSLITTVPVKSEYPAGIRFDIAILDNEALLEYTKEVAEEKGWKNDPFWNQPVRLAIELKYAQLGDRMGLVNEKIEQDISKLRNYQSQRPSSRFLGISILFIQTFGLQMDNILKREWQLLENNTQPQTGIYRCVITPEDFQIFKT